MIQLEVQHLKKYIPSKNDHSKLDATIQSHMASS